MICQKGTVIGTEVTEAALDQIKQEFPIVFSALQVFCFLAVFLFQCLTKLLIFIEIFSKNILAVWNRNIVVRDKEKDGRHVVSKIISCSYRC